jgi:hypothetical protein
MNVDEALKQPGQLVAVWDEGSDDNWLGIYVAGDSGVKLLAFERNAGAARRADLATRKVPVGATAGGEFVWAPVGEQLVVWNLRNRLAVAGKQDVVASGQRVADVARVTSFVDGDNLGHRGVRVDRATGGQLVIAEEHDPTPEMDPTYDRANLTVDALWATLLGRALAKWLGVKHDDQI